MKLTLKSLGAILMATGLGLTACDDSEGIGNSIVDNTIDIRIDSAFVITGHSEAVSSVLSRSDNMMIGNIDAKGFGTMSSDFVTQFMPANKINVDKYTSANVDSLRMVMMMEKGNSIGDTLAPLGLEVYRLKKEIPGNINTDFDADSYFTASDRELIASKVYTASVVGLNNTIAEALVTNGVRAIYITLPRSLGQEFFDKYTSPGGPELFNDPEAFARWFPGVYVKNSFGSGRVGSYYATQVQMFLSRHEIIDNKDSVISVVNSFLTVTPEVRNNNNIRMRLAPEINTIAATKPVVVAPVGYNSEINIPVRKLVDTYKAHRGDNNVVNTLTLNIPVEEIANSYSIEPPKTLLLVRKDKMKEFFDENKINNDTTSFYADYNSTTKSYYFGSMRAMAIDLIERDAKEGITAADGEFVLVPVTLITETVQVSYYEQREIVVGIIPYVETPAMASLKLDEAKLKMTYTKQTMIPTNPTK